MKALNTLHTTGANRQVVLVAEDEAIIGFELAESLRLEGFEVAGPFDTLRECGGVAQVGGSHPRSHSRQFATRRAVYGARSGPPEPWHSFCRL